MKTTFWRLCGISFCWLLISAIGYGQDRPSEQLSDIMPTPTIEDPTARARELMEETKTAIGTPSAWTQMTSLSAVGRLRRYIKYISVQAPDRIEEKEKTLNGKVRLDFLLPDRFWRRVSNSMLNGYGYTYTQIINGERAWRYPAPLITSHRDNRIYDVGDIERSIELHAHDTRQQIAFYTLGWLLQLPPSFPAEFIHAGQVQVEGRSYETIVIRGPNGFHPALLIDRETHLPFALIMAFVEARRETVVVEVASVSRQYIAETYARARRERESRRHPPQRHEMQWRFSEHQEVSGLRLPRKITTLLDGQILEELTIPEIKINREVDPKKFEGQPEIKFE